MKITVTTLSDALFVLDVSEDLELENFKAFCEVEAGIPSSTMIISFNGRPLQNNLQTLKEYGIRDGDAVIVQQMQTSQSQTPFALDWSAIQVPGSSNSGASAGTPSRMPSTPLSDDPAYIRSMLLSNPEQVDLLKRNNPRLAEALLSGSLEDFKAVLTEQWAERQRRMEQRQRMLTADPFDTEAQRLIAEEIRRRNVEDNMEAAIEYSPETFGSVLMLYINCYVNGHPVQAFIDSGAQQTIMSEACAERCNVMRLVDQRFHGIAKGIGTQKIIGRVHMVQIQIENAFFTTSFSVLQAQSMDMLLGLDMLKRHQCVIDLAKGVLRIGTTGTETKFLGEGDVHESARLSGADELKDSENPELQKAIAESAKSTEGAAGTSRPALPRDPSTEILATDPFGETEVKELQAHGFTRQQVIAELRRFEGDKTQAMAALFAKSLKF